MTCIEEERLENKDQKNHDSYGAILSFLFSFKPFIMVSVTQKVILYLSRVFYLKRESDTFSNENLSLIDTTIALQS